jgi:hypothetical protein
MRPAKLLTMLAMLPTAAAAQVGGLTFQVPAGWTDLSPGAPAENFAKAPAEFAARAKQSASGFVAVDLEQASRGVFADNVNTALESFSGPISEKTLASAVESMKALGQTYPGASYRPTEQSLVTIDGVVAGRMVGETTMGGTVLKQVAYLLPAKDVTVVLTFSTIPDRFANVEPVFSAAAQGTKGLVKRRGLLANAFSLGGRGALIGGVVGGVLGGLGFFARRRKAS